MLKICTIIILVLCTGNVYATPVAQTRSHNFLFKVALCHALLVEFANKTALNFNDYKSTFDSIQDLETFQNTHFVYNQLVLVKPEMKESGLVTSGNSVNDIYKAIQRMRGINGHFHMSRGTGSKAEEIKIMGQRLSGEDEIHEFLGEIQTLHNSLKENQSIVAHGEDFYDNNNDLNKSRRILKTLDKDFTDNRKHISFLIDEFEFGSDYTREHGWMYRTLDYNLPRYIVENKTNPIQDMNQYYEGTIRSPLMRVWLSLKENKSILDFSSEEATRREIARDLEVIPVYTDWLLYWNKETRKPELLVFYRYFGGKPQPPVIPGTHGGDGGSGGGGDRVRNWNWSLAPASVPAR